MSKYGTHINVKYCGSVKAYKYLYNYENKDHDALYIDVCDEESVNEIKESSIIAI